MPDITSEVISVNALRTRVQLLELLNNILSALEENLRESTKQKIAALFDNMAINQVPWNEQLIKLQMKIMENEDLSKETKDQMLKVVADEYTRSQMEEEKQKHLFAKQQQDAVNGFEQLRKTIKKSRLPKEDKAIIADMIDQAMVDLRAPHQVTVDRASYRQIVKLLNQSNLMSQISAIHTVSDEYLIMYNAGLEPQMEKIVQIAGLSIGRLPRPEVQDINTYLDCVEGKDDKGKGNILNFKDLSPELAEKAVLESTKSRNFSFAKTPVKENGKVDLVCFGGVTEDEKAHYYKEAVQTIAMAAFSMTGKTADFEKRRARHMATEHQKISHILDCISNNTVEPEDQGYIYSINSITDSNNNRFVLTDDYVQFSPESFTCHFNGNTYVRTVNDCEDYVHTLRLNLQSGTGQKVYISSKQKQELNKIGIQAETLVQTLQATNKLDQTAELMTKRDDIRDQLKHSAGLNEQQRTSLLSDLTVTNVALDALLQHMRDEITTDMYINAAIGYELKSREPQHIRTVHSKEDVENADIGNRAMSDYLNHTDFIKGLDINMPGVEDIRTVLCNADFSEFIQKEFNRAEAVQEDQDPSVFTTQDVSHEIEVLNENFNARCQEAMQQLADITMEITHNQAEQVQSYDQTETIGRHRAIWKKFNELIENIDHELKDPEKTNEYDIPEPAREHHEPSMTL